ncbi:MAG: hypothetical protein KF800_18870 [Lysobacter sp.]|nr:hypothetical protein [Lysobacter sp.]
MKKSVLFAASVCMAVSALSLCTNAAAAEGKPRSERGQLVHQIVMKWGNHVQEAYRSDVNRWAREMGPVFANAPLESLRLAAEARHFGQMNSLLLGTPSAGSGTQKTAMLTSAGDKVLGDADKDLVFVPITPCRIIDTRIAGGQIAANSVRSFDVTAVSNYSFQGGDASNCGGAGAAGSFAAAAINFTVVTPSAAGYITAFPFGGTQPLAATVNYTAGDIRGNFAVVRLDQGASANELSVYTFAQTHLVADIVGYFINPGPLVFECSETTQTVLTVAAGATANATAPSCAAGYTQTSTNCQSSTWQMPFVYFSGGTCSAQNNSASSASLRASRTCCRARRT